MIAGCFNIINIIIVYHTIPFDIIMMLHYILVRSEYVYIIFIYKITRTDVKIKGLVAVYHENIQNCSRKAPEIPVHKN